MSDDTQRIWLAFACILPTLKQVWRNSCYPGHIKKPDGMTTRLKDMLQSDDYKVMTAGTSAISIRNVHLNRVGRI